MRTENVFKISKVQFLVMCKYLYPILHLISKVSKSYCFLLDDLLLNVEHSISCHISLTFSLGSLNVIKTLTVRRKIYNLNINPLNLPLR